ncbi:MarR family winged helix-turn-helix transcriptional regulator [Streptomyces parvus]
MKNKEPHQADVPSPSFDSGLLSNLSELVARWGSHRFQMAHGSQINNGLDFASNKVLYVLGRSGPLRPSALAEQLATGRANVSKLVNRLELRGLVHKVKDPHDARASLVELTPLGIELSRDAFRIGDEMLREMTADWSAQEVSIFSHQMARFTRAAAEYERRVSTTPFP